MLDPYRDSFIGRGPELARLRELSQARLVTVLGPGGIGKTRLALAHARERAAGQDVVLVDLVEARSADDLEHLLAAALPGAVLPGEGLGAALAALGPCLVVLDNFEQLAEHAACVGRWLSEAPEAHWLVTSQQRLRIAGEETLELGPLDLPADAADEAAVRASDAGRLFVERARGWSLGEGDAPSVARIVRRLDGIPLAVQLAAARVRVLGARQLEERLDQRFELLVSRERDRLARHATLRAAIDWSWSLCTPEEQTALAQLSVFFASFPLEAAEAVMGLEGSRAALLLEELADKSLVRTSAGDDGPRFLLYESIRAYAAERLDPALRRAVFLRRGAHYAKLTRELGERVTRGGLSFIRQLELELDNMMSSLAALFGGEPPWPDPMEVVVPTFAGIEGLVRIVGGRGKLGALDGLLAAARRLFRAPEEERRSAVEQFVGAGYAAFGRPSEAREHLTRALAAAPSPIGRAHAHYSLALIDLACGRVDEGRLGLEEALRSGGGSDIAPRALGQLGNAELHAGRASEALDRYLAALAGAHGSLAALLEGNAAVAERELGRYNAAALRLERALTLHTSSSDPTRAAGALGYLGAALHEGGAAERARAAYRQAIERLHAEGCRRHEGLLWCWLASLESSEGRLDAAAAALDAAAARCRAVGDRGLATTLELHRGGLDLALARASSDRSAARLRRRAACERLSRPGAETRPSYSTLDHAEDQRFARRLLERALAAGAYLVARDGASVTLPDGSAIDLARSPRSQRLLAALCEQHQRDPDATLSLDALIAAGWPDERVPYASAVNRLHVALTGLRNQGLRDVLVREGEGYRLEDAEPLIVR